MLRPQHVLILSTADWTGNLLTNKQHLASGLARAGIDVTFCESLGLRRPRLTVSDAARMKRRIKAWMQGPRTEPEGPMVISPIVLPTAFGAVGRQLNGLLLSKQLRSWCSDDTRQRILWTFSPVTSGLERFADSIVYHSVDFLSEFPGVPPRVVQPAETALVNQATEVIASSEPIAEHLRSLGRRDVRLWENVADVELFSSYRRGPSERSGVVFAGNLTPAKVDFDLLDAVAAQVSQLHLAGPIDEGGRGKIDPKLSRIMASDNVQYHGVLDQVALAKLLGTCRLGLIPYRLNGYTRGVYPLKVFEYLASGCAVLTTPLLTLQRLDLPSDDFLVAESDRWKDLIIPLLAAPDEEVLTRRLRLAEHHSWAMRIADAVDLLEQLKD